ncbi:hypothetical protein SUGI_1507190 [Cryptomeria japonica]|uniref:CDP-diacylglycerol--glycerol-3-phosphate 3-phosphatidyltransferase n=1 Tax=Cryptomeria japonica TaxID=3369 RepID=A0AAD3RRN4_CRYJA|nr:hypothetical protein SUGI_1507190 [Cryptomeria japonica]
MKKRTNWPDPTKKVFTLPNILTMSRIATAPAIGYFIWNGMYNPAMACFAYAAATDFLDGFIARRLNQETDVGTMLDPIADKLLLTTSFVALFNVGLLPLWATKIFIFRDLMLIGCGTTIRCIGFDGKLTWRKFLDLKNYPTIGFTPTYTGKCNTALQCLIVATHLTTNQLAGSPIYDWSIFGLHSVTALTNMYLIISVR